MNWKKVMLALVLIDVALMGGIWGVAKLTPSTPTTQAISDEAEYLFNNLRAEKLRRQITNRTEFTPPANGRLTAGQISLVIEVWKSVDPALSRAHDSLWRSYWDKWPNNGRPENAASKAALREVRRRDLAMSLQAMPAQVAVLNRHGVSLGEYQWCRATVLEALVQKSQAEMARAVSDGRATIAGPPENTATVLAQGKPANDAIAANVALLAGYDDGVKHVEVSSTGF